MKKSAILNLAFSAIFVLSWVVARSTAVFADALVAHWKFDEGTDDIAQDSSPFQSTGQVINGPVWTAGKLGNALKFDGVNDYVNVGNPSNLRLTGSMTIALWMYANEITGSDVLVSKSIGYGDVGWQLDLENGVPTFVIGHPNELSKTSTRLATIHLSIGRWYHVVGVYNASQRLLDMYVDGVLSNGLLRGAISASQRNSSQNVNIARKPNNRRHFGGILDDIRIYNRALSSQEIASLARGDGPSEEPAFKSIYEAEHAALTSPMVKASDPAASSGEYISVVTGKSSTSPVPEAVLPFTIPSEGVYYLWARMKAASGQSDALYIGIDNSWDRVYPKIKNSYQWVRVRTFRGSGVYEFPLATGQHTFQVSHGEVGARLDALLLTTDPSEAAPSDGGSIATVAKEPKLLAAGDGSDGLAKHALCTLQQPPFAPQDTSLFMPQVYAAALPLKPALEGPFDEVRLRQMIGETLRKRFGGDDAQAAEGLAVFDSPAVAQTVPDPRLRAGFALLVGTAGEGALDAIGSGTFAAVNFGILPVNGVEGNTSDAQVVVRPDGTPEIIFSEIYQHEDPRLFAPILAHEALHQDETSPPKEELIALALDSMVYAQFILEDPRLARSATELARRQNTKFMALLNSRDAEGNLRLFTSQGNVYPGGTPLPYFGFLFRLDGLEEDTPGNEVLASALETITCATVEAPDFDDAAVALLDQQPCLFTPGQLVRLAGILKLDIQTAPRECRQGG